MCTNEDCKKQNECYRFQAKVNEYRNSYISDPKQDCENNDYILFWKILGKNIK